MNDAAPDAFAQLHADDAGKYGINDGDLVEVESRRGRIVVPARIGSIGREGRVHDILPGHVFVPFHYGYWDDPGRPRAANELTQTAWDPISKQPTFKYAAVRVRKYQGEPKASLTARAAEMVKDVAGRVQEAVGGVHSGKHIDQYLGLLHAAEQQLADALTSLARQHPQEPEVVQACEKFAAWCVAHVEALKPFIDRYQEEDDPGPERLRGALFQGPRAGTLGLMRDVQDLWVLAQDAQIGWLALAQVSKALLDRELEEACKAYGQENNLIIAWCHTQFKSHIAQALLMG